MGQHGPPNNLPEQLTSFVGRAQERELTAQALASTRLLTMTGAGGSGKTRLALEVAAAAADSFPDGTWWVELASSSATEHVAEALADVLGARPLPGRTQAQAVTQRLAGDAALVVLDNCEHVLDGAADLAEALLRACPNVAVLATSRVPLQVPGESVITVPALSLPGSNGLGEVGTCDAGALFVERARKVCPGFRLDDSNAKAIGRICAEVDGLPLAIELAAARMRMLSPEQIADGLQDRFRLLTGGPRGVQPRQQTLRASVDWSYALLAEPERVLLRRLGVFAGGWSLKSAEAVCSGDGLAPGAILDLLASLVDQSWVVVERQDRVARHRMLETVRQYARELLDASGESQLVRDRHLDYYTSLAASAESELHTPRVRTWIDLLDPEVANIQAAIDHAIGGRAEDALRIGVGLTGWWKVSGRFTTGHDALRRALEAAATTASPLRARALWSCGFMAQFRGDPRSSVRCAQEALDMAESIGDDWTVSVALHALSTVRMRTDPVGCRAGYLRGLEHIFDKLQIHSRSELAALAARRPG